MTTRLEQQIEFTLEIDKLKSVMRRSYIINGERRGKRPILVLPMPLIVSFPCCSIITLGGLLGGRMRLRVTALNGYINELGRVRVCWLSC